MNTKEKEFSNIRIYLEDFEKFQKITLKSESFAESFKRILNEYERMFRK